MRQFAELRIKNLEFRIYLKNNPRHDLPRASENWKYRVLKPRKLWTQLRLPLDLYMHKSRPDVFFSPSHYAPRFSPVPSVISVMDLSFLYYPELFNKRDLFQLHSWTAYSVKKAKKIITISNSSKNDIIKEYKIGPGGVYVTYPGIKSFTSLNPQIYAMNQLKTKYNLDKRYILFVGTVQPRKNIARLIEAFSKLDEKDLELVIVGKKGWLYEEIFEKPEQLGIEEKVKFLDQVTNDELPMLYKHAVCMVLPSLYEGFGLPILEAMKNDCPVITSNVSSLPEAGGDACLYVNPEEVDDIAETMSKLINDGKLRKELIEKGRKQVTKFSWENTARETLRVLEEVGGQT
ncbi:MAG TPA: glycosyltransferase family 1 protein, partial [Xanthomonadales bacterium]|nr:glycosyltransferase family 1 protein [Xanthomonadales bacterium]